MQSGDVVALTLAEVDCCGHKEQMSGLFVLDQFAPYEPAAYVNAAGWWIRPISDGPEPGRMAKLHDWEAEHDVVEFWIDDDELTKNADPREWAKVLEQERMMEIGSEMAERDAA